MQASGSKPRVDDDAVEDVRAVIDEDTLDGAHTSATALTTSVPDFNAR